MTLRQLFYLCEMCHLPQSVGRGKEEIPASVYPNTDSDSALAISVARRSAKRVALNEKIWNHIIQIHRRIHHRDPPYVWVHCKEEGFMGFICLWDHWQSSLFEIVCARRPQKSSPVTEHESKYLWDESEDEYA